MNDLTFLNQEIARLTDIRDKLTDHIQGLHAVRRRIQPSSEPRKVKPSGTRTMFRCEQVEPYIREWLQNYERMNNGYSGVRVLSERARISHVTLTNITGETLSKGGERQEFVTPRIADKLFMAMGLPHKYDDLEEVHIPAPGRRAKPPEPPYSKCDD